MSHADALSIGFNCALGAEQLRPHIEEMASSVPIMVSVHPNAGLPNEFGEYDQSPAEMASLVANLLAQDSSTLSEDAAARHRAHRRARQSHKV